LHVWSYPRPDYIFQVSSKSVQGFRSPGGSKFGLSHYFGRDCRHGENTLKHNGEISRIMSVRKIRPVIKIYLLMTLGIYFVTTAELVHKPIKYWSGIH